MTTQSAENLFSKLVKIDCSDHTEKKGAFTYLSWPWAVQKLRENDPSAIWEVRRFEGMPYYKTELGYFVEVSVTAGGVTLSQIHPVLDGRNQPIAKPSTFHINTSIQRCLVKAIALHGLGLYIYAGEDLPDADEPKKMESSKSVAKASLESLGDEEQAYLKGLAMEVLAKLPDEIAMYEEYEKIKKSLDADEQAAWWSFFDSKSRASLKNGKDLMLAGAM